MTSLTASLKRRYHYHNYHKQQDGQDGISWREELHNMADDAAIEEMETADLLCVIYVTGVKNDELREKLLEVNDPTIAKFDRVVDSFLTKPKSS